MKRTIIDLFEESVAKYATKEFLLEKHNGKFEPTTYEATRQEVLKVGAGLVALGIKPERVATTGLSRSSDCYTLALSACPSL